MPDPRQANIARWPRHGVLVGRAGGRFGALPRAGSGALSRCGKNGGRREDPFRRGYISPYGTASRISTVAARPLGSVYVAISPTFLPEIALPRGDRGE